SAGSSAGRARINGVRARLFARLGEVDQAEAELAAMEAARPTEVSTFDGDLARARSAVAAARGDLRTAQSLALEAADQALELGQYAMVVTHCHDAARYGQVAAAADRVRPIASRLTGPLLPVMANHLLAWQRSDAEQLDAASQAFAARAAYLLAAEAAI